MKVVVITRDWKGSYEDIDSAKGMILIGGEDDIDTGQDYYALVFADSHTERSPQELHDIWYEAQDEGCEGCTVIDDDTIEID
jgi:hypothetical protein